MIFATTALAVALAVLPASTPPKFPAVPPVTLTGAWTSIPLPAAPLGIAVHNGTIWVCGWNEMIAESTDGGRNWTVRNLKTDQGELLFSFAFFGQGKMAVFGSAGVWYSSADGGATWLRLRFAPELGLSQVLFTDANDGYGVNATQLAWTHDGGGTWSFTSDRLLPVAVAALGPSQAAVVANQEGKPDERFFITSDAGKHWKGFAFPKAWVLTGLFANGSAYRVYGWRTADGEPVPLSAVSNDGKAWRTSVQLPPASPSDCNDEGCEFGKGEAWASYPLLAPAFQIPEDVEEPLTADWAANGDTFCRASQTLRCRVGREPWAPPAQKSADTTVVRAPVCKLCPGPKYPQAERSRRVEGTVVVEALIGKDGRIDASVVGAAPSAQFALAALEDLRQWRFDPMLKNGEPTAAATQIMVNFRFYPW